MRSLFFIFLLLPFVALTQTDKIYLMNGKVKKGTVISVGTKSIFVKLDDSVSRTVNYLKQDILLIEKYDGKVMVFGKKDVVKDSTRKKEKVYQHSLSFEPVNVFFGRVTGCYEYTNKSGTVGFLFPVSLTFDPVGPIFQPTKDSTGKTSNKHQAGMNFIAGADVNFYVGKGQYKGLFFGPRVRYGVDMFLKDIEAYSVQTQFGMKLGGDEGMRFFHQFSIGFGFVRVLSSRAGTLINPKESFGWASINYRLGFNW
jgi:hypothetical protein